MSAGNTTSAAKARKLEHQQKALELRRAGLGYVDIGARLGLGKSQAHRLVKAALAECIAAVNDEATQLKAEELSRLDGMLTGIWADARKGHLGAIEKVLKIMERRAKLLGLDAPTRHALGGDENAPPIKSEHAHTMTDADLEAIARGGS